MECPSRRAILYLFVLSTIYVSTAVCQNVLLEGESRLNSQPLIMDSNREIVTSNSLSPKAQIMNTLFSIASGKKGFSEIPPTAQAMIQEKQYATMNQNQRPNICNVVSMSPQTSTFIPKEAISVSQPMITTTSLPQPAIPSNPMSNIMMGTSFTSPYSAPYIRPYQPAVVPAASSVPRPPRPPQIIPLENYANTVQSYPTVWQTPPTINDFYSYNSHAPLVYAEPTLNVPNWEICPPSSVLPAVNTDSGNYDIITRSCNSDISVTEPVVVMNDSEQGLPFNVHINVPPLTMPVPRITLVSSAPAPSAMNPDPYPSYSPFSYPPPLIMRNSRSSWKKMLPIILIALFSDQGSHGGCCCPCNCACDSDSPTPIPYPIPIPVNNPIINNSGSSKYSSRRGENTPNEDDNNEN